MRIYESMCPSFYGNVYIHEKQSIPMECFRCVERESQIQFMCRFAVQNSQKKQMSVPEQNGICDERIFRFKNNNTDIETAVRQNEEWIEILRQFEKQKSRPKPIQVWYDNQTLKRDAEDNNKLLPVSTRIYIFISLSSLFIFFFFVYFYAYIYIFTYLFIFIATPKHSGGGSGSENARVSAIASASRRKRQFEIKRQLRTPQRMGIASNTLISSRASVGCEIELNQLQDYDSDTFRTPKYSSTHRGGGGRNYANSELTLHDLPRNTKQSNNKDNQSDNDESNNSELLNHHFISPTRLFKNNRNKMKNNTKKVKGNISGTSSEDDDDTDDSNSYRKKGLSDGDRSILHPFILSKNRNINLPPIAPLKTPIPTLQIQTERDGVSSTKLSSQLVSRKQTRDYDDNGGAIDLDDDGISEK